MANFKSLPIDQFLTNLAAKQPTPGGGAAAAIGGAVGSAAASMAAAYTQVKIKKNVFFGAAGCYTVPSITYIIAIKCKECCHGPICI